MTRLAENRDTPLTAEEIASEALHLFDAGDEPSIRRLASALRVAPSAIYHHYPSRAKIVEAAVQLVWNEVTEEGYAMIPDPFAADPADVLVAAGIATRRVWHRHYRLAPAMAATPESTEFLTNTLALMANVFERLGLPGESAGACFHTYASFTLGSVLFSVARRLANEHLEGEEGEIPASDRFRSEYDPASAGLSSEATRLALDEVMDVSASDPVRDEELFANGLRRLIASFAD